MFVPQGIDGYPHCHVKHGVFRVVVVPLGSCRMRLYLCKALSPRHLYNARVRRLVLPVPVYISTYHLPSYL
jgi:hypothetical protein